VVSLSTKRFLVRLANFATTEVLNDLARAIDGFLLRVRVSTGALVLLLDHVPTAAILVWNDVAIAVVALAMSAPFVHQLKAQLNLYGGPGYPFRSVRFARAS